MSRSHFQGFHRGMDAAADGLFGRFGRMFPGLEGPEYDEDSLFEIAKSMIKNDDPGQPFNTEDDDENPDIPSAYTYFGQFVDHDLTLDKTSLGESEADPDAVQNFRSPALDLDSVYGNGPWGDVVLYDEDFRLQVSTNRIGGPLVAGEAFVRTQFDHRRDSNGVALIGDPRNDENIIVAQLHQAFVSFHNKIMDTDSLMAGVKDRTERFRRARRLASWHYQWVVINDFLKRICHPAIYAEMVNPGGNPHYRHYRRPGVVFRYMPIEFAGAAYRFGHSMVRPSYALNKSTGTDVNTTRIPIFDSTGGNDLRGFKAMSPGSGIDWGFFFGGQQIAGDPPTGMAGTDTSQPSYRIDSFLVDPLKKLVNPDLIHLKSRDRNLGFRNLLRGSRLRLPTAEQVAQELRMNRLPASRFPILSKQEIWSAGSRLAPAGNTGDENIDEKRDLRKALAARFEDETPLWYYILREAEWYGTAKKVAGQPDDIRGGRHLGPIGSTIVLETFLGILDADPGSILKQGAWRPRSQIAGGAPGKFDLAGLVKWALT